MQTAYAFLSSIAGMVESLVEYERIRYFCCVFQYISLAQHDMQRKEHKQRCSQAMQEQRKGKERARREQRTENRERRGCNVDMHD